MPGSRQIQDWSEKIAERQCMSEFGQRPAPPSSRRAVGPCSSSLAGALLWQGRGNLFDLPIPGSATHCDFAALRLSVSGTPGTFR
jgi:hypothetical protein